MKLSRIAAAGAGLALVGASVLAGAGAAQADDFYLTTADLTAAETNPYSPGWFRGNVTGVAGTTTSTANGLTIVGGNYQLLNGSPVLTDLSDAAATAGIVVSSGAAAFQIPVFTTAGSGYTTLYADAAGIAADVWYTSTAFGPYAANATDTIANFEAAMDPSYEILAFGFNTVGVTSKSVAAISWNGDTYFFLPTATATLSPATTTPAAWDATDVILSATGLIPGEEVIIGVNAPQSGGSFSAGFADVNGNFSYALEGDATADLGTYEFFVNGFDSGVQVQVDLVVTANVAAAALPNTGADISTALIGGSVLLAAGAAFAIVAARRRTAASN